MSMDTSKLSFPKAEPRKQTKARNDRASAKVVKSVRAQCVAREKGLCRIMHDEYNRTWMMANDCVGRVEWAHLHSHRRSQTRGQAARKRHTTVGSLMLCAEHHQQYDAHRLRITALSRKGADGPLKFTRAK